MTGLPVFKGKFRVLDFDIENRPASYWVPDRPTAEITAIAACFVDQPRSMQVWLLAPAVTDADHKAQMVAMLEGFRAMYDQASMVTGHYITRHDLPIINGSMMEWGLPLLGPKMVQDTRTQLKKKGDMPATQEHLSDMFELAEAKHHMKQSMWRQANRLTVEGMAATRKRVVDDVRQHMRLREALSEAGYLRTPKEWSA